MLKSRAKKPVTKPLPDVKSATCEILARVAEWMESGQSGFVFPGNGNKRLTKEEQTALDQARNLAIEYVKLGARG
jgi:hypothetical protein